MSNKIEKFNHKAPSQSKIKFFKKENCKYQIHLLEDGNQLNELYEVKVFYNNFNIFPINSSIIDL